MDKSQEVIHFTLQSLHVCCRIKQWAESPATSALVSLAKEGTLKLIQITQSMGAKLIESQLSSHKYPCKDMPAEDCQTCLDTMQALRAVNYHIMKMNSMLSFCIHNKQDIDKDEGALNALLATSLLDDEAPLSRHETTRLARVVSDVVDIAAKLVEASDRDQTCAQESAGLHFAKHVQPLVDRMSPQIQPRYIHRYTSRSEVPYEDADNAVIHPICGSNAVVSKVHCRRTREPFAKKSFHNVYTSSSRRMVKKELAILELCRHRNLITLVDAYEVDEEDEGAVHIVMAPWAPYTLTMFLRSTDSKRTKKCPWFAIDSPDSDKHIYRIMLEVVDAVAYLHDKSIKHKDLKPDNILLLHENTTAITPILTDVGVSKVFRNGGPTDYIGSSYVFLAPEQLKEQDSSLKADIWQLGCCLAMLLTTARGGKTALERLWTSFQYTDEDCSCNIAGEYDSFMETLRVEFADASDEQREAYRIVTSTLARDLNTRPGIHTVRGLLKDLVEA